jgi:hypothetical protein
MNWPKGWPNPSRGAGRFGDWALASPVLCWLRWDLQRRRKPGKGPFGSIASERNRIWEARIRSYAFRSAASIAPNRIDGPPRTLPGGMLRQFGIYCGGQSP